MLPKPSPPCRLLLVVGLFLAAGPAPAADGLRAGAASLSLKWRARLDHVFFLGYRNDSHQYSPTLAAAAEGGYGAAPTVSPAEVSAGERMIDRALFHLSKMRGRLPDLRPETKAEAAFVKTTHAYKVVDGTKVEADVHRADDAAVRPVVVWLHGGALIVGSRSAVPQRLLDLCRTEGYALVSFDYRLAPEAKLPAIAEDVEDAFRWLRGDGAKRFRLDAGKVVVAGGSAGGYLTLLAGARVRPRPTALVAYWGYGDVDGDWYAKPSEHYRTAVPLVSREDALAAVGRGVRTEAAGNSDEQKGRTRYYHYLRQNGLWTKEVTGFDPASERRKLDPYCPVRNVTAEYPPALLVHGTRDDDVPYEQSAAMAKALAGQKVPHELVTVEGAGHGLAGGDKKRVDEAHARALAFIRKHLK